MFSGILIFNTNDVALVSVTVEIVCAQISYQPESVIFSEIAGGVVWIVPLL